MVLAFQTILSKIAWALGPVCVLLAIGLISLVIYVYFVALLPQYMSEGYLSFTSVSHIILALWLSFNLPFNYFMCISTNPGRPGPHNSKPMDQTIDEDDYCYVCKAMKPQRTHHCSVCNKCTLRMDHHCPWMANCVGHYNYKYFVLFLFYMAVSCFYVFTICSLPTQYGGVVTKVTVPGLGRGVVNFVNLLCLSVELLLEECYFGIYSWLQPNKQQWNSI